MFSRVDNASKVALVWLVAILKQAGFKVLDCQFMTDHLASLGAVAISQYEYTSRIAEARGESGITLDEAYSALISGVGVAGGTDAGEGASCDGASVTSPRRSSPGKLIAQSFTQTS